MGAEADSGDLAVGEPRAVTVGVPREVAEGERRVALVPQVVGRLRARGLTVVVEPGAGLGALIPDEQYTDAGEGGHEALLFITTRPALRHAFLDSTAGIEPPLSAVIAERLGDTGAPTARVLAASVAAAVRIALEGWLRPAGEDAGAAGSPDAGGSPNAGGLVVPVGSLSDRLRAALAPLAPSFDAAERRVQP